MVIVGLRELAVDLTALLAEMPKLHKQGKDEKDAVEDVSKLTSIRCNVAAYTKIAAIAATAAKNPHSRWRKAVEKIMLSLESEGASGGGTYAM